MRGDVDVDLENEIIIKPKYNDEARNDGHKFPLKREEEELFSRMMKEPIINKDYFLKSLSKQINSKDISTMELKLLNYPILKEIMDQCGSYPVKTRFLIWRYLLSLPGNESRFKSISLKGVHPFYRNINETFPIKDTRHCRKMQSICSLISHWSPHLGNIYFLPNMIFPFIKSINGDDLFLFELLVGIFNSFCQYWFEFYPGAPLNHMKICEKIIEKESGRLFSHLASLGEEDNNMKLNEIIWRFFKHFFSESFPKDNWLQILDFVITYNHKPEILLYLACSLMIKQDKLILKTKSFDDLKKTLFNSNIQIDMIKLFKHSLHLMNKYSKYQIYKYKPYQPFPVDQYPLIDKFPLDFLSTTAKIREDLFKEEEQFEIKKNQINLIEKKFYDLAKKEELMQMTYASLIHKEKEKAEIYKKELDLILYQKSKFYDEIKNRKLDKVNKLENLIDKSLNFYDKMKQTELRAFEEEMKKKKELEEFDIKSRLQQEELNNLEFESNRKMIELLNLRTKNQEDLNSRTKEDYAIKERDHKKRLLEEKWKLEDEEIQRRLEDTRNLKEYRLLQTKDLNNRMQKEYLNSLNEFEENLLIQEIEKERKNRLLLKEFEENKALTQHPLKEKEDLYEKQHLLKLKQEQNKELDNTKLRNKQHLDILMKNYQENIDLLEKEEYALREYEETLKIKEYETKLQEMKSKNEIKAIESEREFQRQYIEVEEMKRQHRMRREELERKKREILYTDNTNEIDQFNQSQQREILNKYRSIYDRETENKIDQIRNNKLYTKDYNSNTENKNSTETNLRLINEGIRNLTSNSNNILSSRSNKINSLSDQDYNGIFILIFRFQLSKTRYSLLCYFKLPE
jgi:hypothetical protein